VAEGGLRALRAKDAVLHREERLERVEDARLVVDQENRGG